MNSLWSEWSINTVIHFHFYFFLSHRRALFALDQSEARFIELGEYSQNILSEAFWTPNIASLQLDENPKLDSWSKSLPNQEPNMFAKLFQVRRIPQTRFVKQNFTQARMGLSPTAQNNSDMFWTWSLLAPQSTLWQTPKMFWSFRSCAFTTFSVIPNRV